MTKFECALIMVRVMVATVIFLILPVYIIYMEILRHSEQENRVIEMCGVWYGIDCDGHATELFLKHFRKHIDNMLYPQV